MTTLKNRQITFNSPRGYLINGKIVPSVASNNLTVAIKTLAGNDPSASDPVYCRIGDTVRSITSALSITANAGTAWFEAGSSELATKEIDYFVYLYYSSTSSAVDIGFARVPYFTTGTAINGNSTHRSYMKQNQTIQNADEYENIGRFAATLSAGAGYTWSVPTYTATNLIQRPIFETRWLDFAPNRAVSGGTAPTYTYADISKYKIRYESIIVELNWLNQSGGVAGSGTSVLSFYLPFYAATTYVDSRTAIGGSVWSFENGGTGVQTSVLLYGSAPKACLIYTTTGVTGADQSSVDRVISGYFEYRI